jgi:hypothetical protein
VVQSLWAVDDRTASELLLAFHRELLNSPHHDFMANGHNHKNSSARHFELFWNLVQGRRRSRPAPVKPKPPEGTIVATSSDLLCPEVRP